MTFSEAYAFYGPDVELIAQAMGIDPPDADRLINLKLDRLHETRIANSRVRADLAEIRARRPA